MSPAQCNLGDCYYKGIGVAKDYEKAMLWFRQGAEVDHPYSLYSLGFCYEKGQGTEADRGTALYYYRRAAALGSASGKKALERLEGSAPAGE